MYVPKSNPGAYGRSVRINITKKDRRIFTATLMTAQTGRGSIIGAHLWNGSITVSITALDLKSTISVVGRRCRPELSDPSHSGGDSDGIWLCKGRSYRTNAFACASDSQPSL